MKIIIGLGNPGKKYENTKHNLGFKVLDYLAGNLIGKNPKWHESKDNKALYLKTEFNGEIIELVKPQTFMNNSGFTVAKILKKHNLKPEDIFVIYDDLDINFGNLKIGYFESAGGHNGIKSIIQNTKINNFLRFRLGIKTPLLEKVPTEKYVLTRFSLLEKMKLKKIIHKTNSAIIEAIENSPLDSMNKFN